MKQNITVLFDMDGVIVDTEPQYDIIWKSIGDEYLPEVVDFEKKIKGTILPNLLTKWFPHLNKSEQQVIVDRVAKFELNMTFEEIPGALAFVRSLKDAGISVGLVTSSGEEKVAMVYEKMELGELFDTLVSAGRITDGKPHPMCYLLAAKDLKAEPSQCIVFEDSFAGIKSATSAGMKVVGLSTTNPAAQLRDKVCLVIPDFRTFSLNDLNGHCS